MCSVRASVLAGAGSLKLGLARTLCWPVGEMVPVVVVMLAKLNIPPSGFGLLVNPGGDRGTIKRLKG